MIKYWKRNKECGGGFEIHFDLIFPLFSSHMSAVYFQLTGLKVLQGPVEDGWKSRLKDGDEVSQFLRHPNHQVVRQ